MMDAGSADKQEYALDWLTGLLPVVLISLFNYHWQALWLMLLAAGGYLMASVLLERLCKAPRERSLLPQAFLTGVLLMFCLPATAPFWLAALGGGLAAVLAVIPQRVKRVPLPRLHPVVLTYVLLRLLIPQTASGYVLPYQWVGMDALSAATPLAALRGGETVHSAWQLFFGVRAGAIGEICVAAVLLAALYLLLRRRLRLIAPGCVLATVSLLSWLFWNSPLYGLLAGATALTALLLADRAYMPHPYVDQIIAGITAGVVMVLMRRFAGWGAGAAVGLLAAQLTVFLRVPVCDLLRRIPLVETFLARCRDIFCKKKNNG